MLYISSATLHQYLYSAAKEITHGRATWGVTFPPSSRFSSGQLHGLPPRAGSLVLLVLPWLSHEVLTFRLCRVCRTIKGAGSLQVISALPAQTEIVRKSILLIDLTSGSIQLLLLLSGHLLCGTSFTGFIILLVCSHFASVIPKKGCTNYTPMRPIF